MTPGYPVLPISSTSAESLFPSGHFALVGEDNDDNDDECKDDDVRLSLLRCRRFSLRSPETRDLGMERLSESFWLADPRPEDPE